MADYSFYNEDRTQKLCRGICGEMLPLSRFRNRRDFSSKGHWVNSVCRKCEAAGIEQYRTMTKEGIVAELFRRKKSLCRVNHWPFDLTKEWLREQLDKQEWKCALTGIPFRALKVAGEKRSGYRWDSVSLDRVDPRLGYVQSNVRFILNVINLFKNDGDDKRMYMLAEALLRQRRTRKGGPSHGDIQRTLPVNFS
jgi:hypothetical protein